MKTAAFGALWTIFVVLITLKLTIAPALPWWLVLAPLYGYPLAIAVIVIVIVIIAFPIFLVWRPSTDSPANVPLQTES